MGGGPASEQVVNRTLTLSQCPLLMLVTRIRLLAMELAARFTDLRIRAGLTKTALARPRYSVSYVSQIESGRRTPSSEAMAYFAERLGVAPGFLATGIPVGLEEELKYRLEEGRRSIRDSDLDKAEEIAREVADIADRYSLRRLHARALHELGESLAVQDRNREAIDKLEEALQGDLPEREAGMAVSRLARTYRNVGDLNYAAEIIEDRLYRGGHHPVDPGVMAELQAVLISIYFERGDVMRAERAARRALAAADQGAPPDIRANVYWDASRVLAESKQWDEALEFATRARVLMEELDDQRSVARLHTNYAFICLEADPPRGDEAREHLDVAESWLSKAGAGRELAYVYEERGRLALLEERPDEAVRYADLALESAGQDELEAGRSLYVRGRALALLGRRDDARLALQRSADLFEKLGARQQQAAAWRELGELDLAEGDVQSAVESLRAGLEALDPRRARA
jgi:tetratricopeptide (TPR) repeat protein